MKLVAGIFIVLTCAQATYAGCLGEAQIIAKVEAVQPMPPNACFVKVAQKSIRLYKENPLCPLDLAEVLHGGIEVGLRTEDHCVYVPGDEISGVIYEDFDGTIRLER